MLKYILVALICVVVAAALFVRFAPLSAATYHVPLQTIEAKGARGTFSVGSTADVRSPHFDTLNVNLAEAARRVRDVIEATPRTTLLAGALQEVAGKPALRATYVTRSGFWGFPDVTTIELEKAEIGVTLSMTGRQVYGIEDFGVNEQRLRGWLEQIDFN